MAALLVPEPIFEAGFVDSSYGRHPGRLAHDALAEIRQHLQAGRREVYDAVLQGNFDTIHPADHADPQTLVDSVLKAEEDLQAIGCEQSIEEVAADKEYHSVATLELCRSLGFRT